MHTTEVCGEHSGHQSTFHQKSFIRMCTALGGNALSPVAPSAYLVAWSFGLQQVLLTHRDSVVCRSCQVGIFLPRGFFLFYLPRDMADYQLRHIPRVPSGLGINCIPEFCARLGAWGAINLVSLGLSVFGSIFLLKSYMTDILPHHRMGPLTTVNSTHPPCSCIALLKLLSKFLSDTPPSPV